MKLSSLDIHPNMNLEIPRHMDLETMDAESIAARFVDVHGIRRGMERIPIVSTCQNDEAAVGKSRRLMSSCIKRYLSFLPHNCQLPLTL